MKLPLDSPRFRMRKVLLFLALAAFFSLPPGPATAAGELPVFVSIPPQKYFVERVGGDRVNVTVMIPAGANIHAFEPRPRQMADLSRARLYLAIGNDPFESVWLPRFRTANPEMRVVHVEEGIEKIPMAAHRHEDEEGHAERGREGGEGTLDPHVWTSPPAVKILAKNIEKALIQADPAGKEAYEAGYRDFARDLDALDEEIRQLLSGMKGREFMVFHPAWGYFAHAYGLVQVPVEVEGKEPRPAQLAALIDEAREHRIRAIFVQPQISRRAAEEIARAIHARLVAADPLAEDWMENLRKVARELAREE